MSPILKLTDTIGDQYPGTKEPEARTPYSEECLIYDSEKKKKNSLKFSSLHRTKQLNKTAPLTSPSALQALQFKDRQLKVGLSVSILSEVEDNSYYDNGSITE